MPKTAEAAEEIEIMLRPLAKFVDRKTQRAGHHATSDIWADQSRQGSGKDHRD